MGVRAKSEDQLLEYLFSNGKRTANGCLISHLKPNKKGYVPIQPGGRSGKKERAHRWVYSKVCEIITEDDLILHECDIRNCIEPEHLFKGTAQDNTNDMLSKGRERNQHSARLYGYVK